MIAILNFKMGKQVYEIVYERDRYWAVFETIGRIELEEREILYRAETLEDLELIAPEYFI